MNKNHEIFVSIHHGDRGMPVIIDFSHFRLGYDIRKLIASHTELALCRNTRTYLRKLPRSSNPRETDPNRLQNIDDWAEEESISEKP
jgi:CTP:molybdopterin cytidylyltransferase MocA